MKSHPQIIPGGQGIEVKFNLNGEPVTTVVEAQQILAALLRKRFCLTGTKISCASGVCGSCTALLNGMPVTTCSLFAHTVDGCNVITIEGLKEDGAGSSVQNAFISKSAFQCGYCTPGMILLATALLHRNPHPTRREIIDWMSANICRCGGYNLIVDAVMEASGS